MKLQLLSDLHLETESFDPQPAPSAQWLVLAGDIDSSWAGYELFAHWPVPVLVVAGNHEFDGRDFDQATVGLRSLCQRLGFTFLERESIVLEASGGVRPQADDIRRPPFGLQAEWPSPATRERAGARSARARPPEGDEQSGQATFAHERPKAGQGRPSPAGIMESGKATFPCERVRVLGTTRWSDFDLFGAEQRARAERAAEYFMRLMGTQRNSQPFDAAAVRQESLLCRQWLETELQRAPQGRWDKTLVITHFAPSFRSADPRYGKQPGTASFCNADDDLIPRADLWLHGHLHCRQDYRLDRAGRAPARVVCNARGLAHKGEDEGFDGARVLEV